ncbi:hypothetical protein HU200_044712 [Digitaria exilis]|uniref:Phosphatidylinositol transfer protein N-terminal domain-containing protein n=1 Tax=Digitaria exilis TaxID=1010633 RepID=A0A835ECT0_9POAL|nr:hypothetical protein HU200_044712 [Digitaria exilis]
MFVFSVRIWVYLDFILVQSRIVMPLSMEEYEIGLSYTIMEMEQQNTNSKEGVEVLQQVPFEDEKLGKGQLTSKVYHLQRPKWIVRFHLRSHNFGLLPFCTKVTTATMCSKIPSWMKGFAPASALTVHEDSWCAFPKSRTDDQCSKHRPDNLQVAKNRTRPSSEGMDGMRSCRLFSNLNQYSHRQETKQKPHDALCSFQDSCRPVMTTYKLVIMDAPIWGLGERLEDFIIAGERALFLACHRLCFAWIDEWYGMTVDQIREMERQTEMLLKTVSLPPPHFRSFLRHLQTLKKPGKAGSKHEGKRKTLKDEIAVVGSCT